MEMSLHPFQAQKPRNPFIWPSTCTKLCTLTGHEQPSDHPPLTGEETPEGKPEEPEPLAQLPLDQSKKPTAQRTPQILPHPCLGSRSHLDPLISAYNHGPAGPSKKVKEIPEEQNSVKNQNSIKTQWTWKARTPCTAKTLSRTRTLSRGNGSRKATTS
jgi:hypothetical protein